MNAATLTPPRHLPARMPSTGEQPTLTRHARTHADAYLAAGRRDARRILKEALAAAQSTADREFVKFRYRIGAALTPGFTADELHEACLDLFQDAAEGVLSVAGASDCAAAMLEGWTQRQQLTAGGAR